MSVNKRYRVIVRQRVNWVPGTDNSVPESSKPAETEGASIERDVTDYVSTFSIKRLRSTLANEASFDFINPSGLLTPNNASSAANRYTINGVDTFCPILVEGNELQYFHVPEGAAIGDRSTWEPRFRGKISSVSSGIDRGKDSLRVVVSTQLSELGKKTLTGTFSPVLRTTSQVPGNSYYTLPTLQSAVNLFRAVTCPQSVPGSYVASVGSYGAASTAELGEITPALLSKLLWWDRDDVFFRNGLTLAPSYFANVAQMGGSTWRCSLDGTKSKVLLTFDDESYEDTSIKTPVPVTGITATSVWTLNGHSWFVDRGQVSKDASKPSNDSLGSLKLSDARLLYDVTKLPEAVESVFRFGYQIADDASTLTLRIATHAFDRKTFTHGAETTVYSTTLRGKTVFDPEHLGGALLTPVGSSELQWRQATIDIPKLPAELFDHDTDTSVTLVRVSLESAGIVWIDLPSWEFTAVGVSESGVAVQQDSNLLDLPHLERWITEDGITYRSPYDSHKTLSHKNVMAIIRRWSLPYGAGTLKGFGPNNLKNRAFDPAGMYQRELVPNSEFNVLYDKGAIDLSSTFRRCEIFVAGTFYDLAASPHMEASEMLRRLLIEGGVAPDRIFLEPTGVILSQIKLAADTSTSILKAVKEILTQLPQNYHLCEDGDGNVVGRFIQQYGSPRIYNPIIAVPLSQISNSALVSGDDEWYSVSALMPDGKETLISNITPSVPLSNYYDYQHKSVIQDGYSAALKIKPVPNGVGLVIRRAHAYRNMAALVSKPIAPAVGEFLFNSNLAGSSAKITLSDPNAAFTYAQISELSK